MTAKIFSPGWEGGGGNFFVLNDSLSKLRAPCCFDLSLNRVDGILWCVWGSEDDDDLYVIGLRAREMVDQ